MPSMGVLNGHVGGRGHVAAEAGGVSPGWQAELASVFTVELRGTVVSDLVADCRDIVDTRDEQHWRRLQSDLLLERGRPGRGRQLRGFAAQRRTDAGGSRGTTSWAWSITEAAAKLREELPGAAPPVTVTVDTAPLMADQPARERHAFSAVFAEVTVDPATGEVRVRRLLGMFAVGRLINPLLARSQVIGAMIMGLSMALHEEALRDPNSGRHVNADFAGYHIAAHADVPDIEADFVPDYDPDDPSGIKGAGEIGTVGTAAAIANAVWHATGTRHRTLTIRLDRVVE
jgi:hypothetical protein